MLKTNLRLLVFDILSKSRFVLSFFSLGVFLLSGQLSRRDFLKFSAGATVAAGLGMISPTRAEAEPISVGTAAALGAGVAAILAGLGIWNRTVIDNEALGTQYLGTIQRDSSIIADYAYRKAVEANYATNKAELQAIADTGALGNEMAQWAADAIAAGGRMALAGYDALSGLGLMARAAISHFIASQLGNPAATILGNTMPDFSSYVTTIDGFSAIASTYAHLFGDTFQAQAALYPEVCTGIIYFIAKGTNSLGQQTYTMNAIACTELTQCTVTNRGNSMEWVLRGNSFSSFWAHSDGRITSWRTPVDGGTLTIYYTVLEGSGVCGQAIGIDDLPGLEQTPESAALDPPMPWDAPLVGHDLVIDGAGISDPGTIALPDVVGVGGQALPGIGLDIPWTDALWGLQSGVIDRPIAGGLPIPLEGTLGWVGTLEGVQAIPIETALSTPTSIAIDVPASVVPVPPINPGLMPTPVPPWGGVTDDFPLLNIFPFNMTITLVNFLGRLFNG